MSRFTLFLRNLLLVLIISVSFSAASHAQEKNIFFVEGVITKAFATSSGKAKILATKKARQDAFAILLSRLSLDTKIADDIADEGLFSMVSSERITGERISGNGYYAVFNIEFSRSDVERILKEKKVRRENSPQDSFVLIPVKQTKVKSASGDIKETFLLWEEENDWKRAVEKEIAAKSMVQFIVPDSDLSNISVLNKDNVEHLVYEDLEPLFSKYRSVESLVMFFEYDNIENKVTILIHDIKKLQKKQLKLSFVNVERLDYAALMKKVTEKTLEYLLSIKNKDKVKADNFVKVEIPISNLQEWIAIRSKIENSNLVSQLNIEAISKDYAKISIIFVEGQSDIIKAFEEKGIKLVRKSDNLFTLSVIKY